MKHKTISDIAREAEVSKATVSRSSHPPRIGQTGNPGASESGHGNMNMFPTHLAQSLAGNPTKTIGVVIDELSNFFFIEVAEGIGNILSPSVIRCCLFLRAGSKKRPAW